MYVDWLVPSFARYAKNMGLAGFLVWTIDTDDFRPRCYDEPFHLVKSMKEGFNLPADGILPVRFLRAKDNKTLKKEKNRRHTVILVT
ncbi:Chitotriosidase-1 [Portunus trituberculatus]|uniref:Chitotriosidase-1 n=1 Tax=Portunus trituberculatus TaxID=210409 RepID=A0A5B7CU29_PORTR|nr:Chitotriosidase-1 [Portunus trituberculatus]